MNICDLKLGQAGWITKYRPASAQEIKLLEMGLIEGEKVKLKRIAPMGDPIELEIMGYNLCLRKENARNIQISLTPHLALS